MADGARVFFKRRGLRVLRGYFGARFDELPLRSLVLAQHMPKLHVERSLLDGLFVTLTRMPYAFFRGLFSVGMHLCSGRYYQAADPCSIAGLGPRELVLPASDVIDGVPALLLGERTLVGDLRRYARCLDRDPAPLEDRSVYLPPGPVRTLVQGVRYEVPPPVGRWVYRGGAPVWVVDRPTRPTLCLVGRVVSPACIGANIVVPAAELRWRDLPAGWGG